MTAQTHTTTRPPTRFWLPTPGNSTRHVAEIAHQWVDVLTANGYPMIITLDDQDRVASMVDAYLTGHDEELPPVGLTNGISGEVARIADQWADILVGHGEPVTTSYDRSWLAQAVEWILSRPHVPLHECDVADYPY